MAERSNEHEMKPVRCGCGGEAEVDWVLEPSNCYMANVFCNQCGTKTIPFWSTEKDKAIDYAVTTWNRAMGGNVQECAKDAQCTERTAKVETVEKPNVYKCSECGQYFHSTAWGSPVMYCSRCGVKLDWSGNE